MEQDLWNEKKEAFLAWMAHPENGNSYSKHSIRAYSGQIDRFIAFMHENDIKDAKSVNSAWIGAFYKYLSKKALSIATVKHSQGVLFGFWEFIIHDDMTWVNPVKQFLDEQKRSSRRKTKSIKRITPVLYRHEQDALMDMVFAKNHSVRSRDLAMIGLMLDSGLRTEEVCSLTIGQCRDLLQAGIFRVIGKGNKERVIKPLDIHRHWLRDFVQSCASEANDALMFTTIRKTPLTQPALYQLVNKYLEQANINKPQMGGHLLRHTTASMMLTQGLTIRQVQENMGHSSMMITERYVHLL